MATLTERTPPAAAPASRLPRRTVAGLLAATLLVQTGVAWAVAHRSYFSYDDLIIFANLRYGAGIDLLANNAGHLIPGYRVLHWLVYRNSRPHWELSLALVFAFHATSTVLLQRILSRLYGDIWWTFALALAFGVSVINLSLFIDYTISSTVVPAVTFSLAAIHAHLVWLKRPGEGGRWLAWSVVAVALGLLFYEKVALVPVVLVLMWVFVLDQERPVAAGVRAAARAWRVWALYAIPIGVFAAVFLTGNYGQPGKAPDLATILTFLETSWLRAFGAGIFGIFVGPGPPTTIETIGIAGTQIALVSLVAASIVRRPRAWRAWAFFLIAFVVMAVAVSPRLTHFGTIIGANLRYEVEATYLFPLALAFAFAGAPAVRARTVARPRGLALAGVCAAAAAIATLTVFGALASRHASGSPKIARWVHNLRHDVAADRAAGQEPSLLDANAPDFVIPGFARVGPPVNHAPRTVSDVAALLGMRLRFDPAKAPVVRVADDGHLQRLRFDAVADDSLLAAAKAGRAVPGPGQLTPSGRFDCMTAGPLGGGTIEYSPVRPLIGRDWYLAVEVRSTVIALDVSVDRGIGYPLSPDRVFAAGPGRPGNVSVIQVGGLPTGPPTFARMQIFVPKSSRACFGHIRIGSFVPEGTV